MPHLSEVLWLALLLGATPQAPRTTLSRCSVGQDPVARFGLPNPLREVSGLAMGPGGTLLAHSDERGVITVLDGATLQPVRQVQLQGAPRDDFEGIASAGDSVALMTSAGTVYLLQLGAAATAPFKTVFTGLGRACELEGLAWHRASGTLFMPCKQPRGKATLGLTVFRYRLGPTPGTLPPIVLSGDQLARVAGLAQIRPTSVEVNQATGDLVVLSSKPAMLLEVDSTGRAVAMKRLLAKHHPQAEGLTLTPDAIWIADEGTAGRSTLMRYACQ